MTIWTRAHDAHIARECEGWEVHENMHGCDWVCFPPDEGFRWRKLTNYLTDPAAAIRAAEAWRKKEAGRSYHTDSALDDAFGSRPESACCRRNYHSILGSGEGPGALAQALYHATGGPA